MQPQHSYRIDLGGLKSQIVKKIGVESSRKYFYTLNRFLSQKLRKTEFDKLCFRLLGRENLPLHNQLIRSILKNVCRAKTPPPICEVGPTKSMIQTSKSSPGREEGYEQSGSFVPNQNHGMFVWSNGVLPVLPRKARSGIRDRKPRDRPSPLGLSGKVECVSHQSTSTEDNGSKVVQNGELLGCDYQRSLQHILAVNELPKNKMDGLLQQSSGKPSTRSKDLAAFVEDGEEVEQANLLSFNRSSLLAPLGIPLYTASVGGACKCIPVASSTDFVSCYDSGGLSNTEMLRERMEKIASAQGLGDVSMECANMLNNMLDVYLMRLIRSCADLVGVRCPHDSTKHHVHKLQIQGKVMNGMWPSNLIYEQSNYARVEVMPKQSSRCSISLLDFKVAMELNPQQLGEDWPLLLEKICMHAFKGYS